MGKKKFSLDRWIGTNRLYLIAFLLPVLSMMVVYYFKDVFPFGPEMYLRSDNYHQYTPYLQILQDKLADGGSMFYTWQIGSGMNFIAIAAYYLSSPLNLLLAIWGGKVVDLVSIFIVVKMGLAGFSITYYLSKKFNRKDMITAAFGMAYALSAYFAAFSWNIMWLDCMVLLPFIILGLEKLVKEGKCNMYCISLAIAIFSNYYIGIMLCIYSVIYFVYLFFVSDTPEGLKPVKYRLSVLKNYTIYSLLSGGLAASVILPEYFALLTTRSANSTFPETLERYFSMLYMLFRSLLYIPVADLKYPHDPNIYCSVAVFLLIPLYFMCKNINAKERVGKAVLMIVMLISFSFNIPNYIWHGLHFPNSLPCRESFIYIFLIVTMAYEAALHIKEFSSKQIVGTFAGATALILVMEELFADAEFFSDLVIDTTLLKIIYYSIAFIILYTILIFAFRKREDLKGFIIYLMILTSFCELSYNMTKTGIVSTSNRAAYYESNEAFDMLNNVAAADAKANGLNFYRTEKYSHRTRNDGALFGYNSISTFSSVASASMQWLYDDLGMQTSFNAYSYLGHTPLTASLFSIKYEYAKSTEGASSPSTSTILDTSRYVTSGNAEVVLNLYKNNYTLPLGFMVNSNFLDNWVTTSGNPFDVQNNFVATSVNGAPKIFHRLTTDGQGNITIALSADETSGYDLLSKETVDVYFYAPTSAENLTATITGADGVTKTKTFSSTQQNYICHIGDVTPSSTIAVKSNNGSAVTTLYAYVFDKDAFVSYFNIANSQGLNVTEFSDTNIKGEITANASGLMLTSIPYDEGWTIYIDGKEVEPEQTNIIEEQEKFSEVNAAEGAEPFSIYDEGKYALLAVPVEAGTHTIEFSYTPKGFIPGLLISFLSLIVFLVLTFLNELTNFFNSRKTVPQKGTKKQSKQTKSTEENTN